jgi:hypothetical protein
MTPEEWVANARAVAVTDEGFVKVPVTVWEGAIGALETAVHIHRQAERAPVPQCAGESHAFYPCNTITQIARRMNL